MGFAVRDRLVLFDLRQATGTENREFLPHQILSLVCCHHSLNRGAAPTRIEDPCSILALFSRRTDAYLYVPQRSYGYGVAMGG